VEEFLVVVMACALLGVGAWALVAMRHLFTFTDTDSTQRRPGD
jgi:hypothetical protein